MKLPVQYIKTNPKNTIKKDVKMRKTTLTKNSLLDHHRRNALQHCADYRKSREPPTSRSNSFW